MVSQIDSLTDATETHLTPYYLAASDNHGLAQDRERWRQLVETATLQPGARSWW